MNRENLEARSSPGHELALIRLRIASARQAQALRGFKLALIMNHAFVSNEFPLIPTLSPKGAREMSDGLEHRTINNLM
jgi:hypothetical protein